MERHRERGFAALWVIAALGLSTAVGLGVYVVMKERRLAAEAQDATEAAEERKRAAETPISIDASVDGPEAFEVAASPDPMPVAPPPVDRAAAEAVDPEPVDGPPATNAPLFGTPGVDGALDRDAIATSVRTAAPKLQRCFEKRLAAGQVVGGTMRVTLIVNRRGGVTDASAVGVDDELDICVAAALKDIRFARTTDGEGARIIYPIAFHNKDGLDEGDARPSRAPQPSAEGACDEVSCVLDNFEGECCAKFKQPDKLPDEPSAKDLQAAVTLLRTKVARCASDEAFSGKLVVKFQIQPNGSTSSFVIAKAPPRVGGCIVRAFTNYPWPHSKRGIAASFPFQITIDE